jgi:hypothetical protein
VPRGKRFSSANRRHHCAGDDRPDAGHTHLPLAAGILARERHDLACQDFDPVVEPAPVPGQVLDDADHAR